MVQQTFIGPKTLKGIKRAEKKLRKLTKATAAMTIAAPKTQNVAKKSKAGAPANNSYAMCVLRPFENPPKHIPDMSTQPAGLVPSYLNARYSFTSVTGTSNSHAGGLVLYPYPVYAGVQETSAGNAVLTDFPNSIGTLTNFNKVPNSASMSPNLTDIRLVSCVVRVTYEGTELNRSGRYIAALLKINPSDSVVATTGNQLSCFGPLAAATSMSTTAILNGAYKYTTARIVDGTFEAHWEPNGAPRYQHYADTFSNVLSGTSLSTTGGDNVFGVQTSVAGTTGAPNAWNSAGTNMGAEVGQYALIVIFEGDTTTAASNVSNLFAFEVKWEWECVPRNPTAVSYTLEPSLADAVSLSRALNLIEAAPVARVTASANTNPSGSVGNSGLSAKRRGFRAGTY
jgi:hypothetical protein